MIAGNDDLTLQELVARYEGLLNAAVEAIIVIDSRGKIEAFSAGAQRIFGYLSDEVLGENVSILMPTGDADHHDGYIQNFQQSRKARIIGIGREVEGRHKSGRVFPMDLSIGEIESPTGKKFVGIGRDITRRKVAELALLAREEENRRIIEHAPVGILTTDPAGLMLTLNPALQKLLGASDHTLAGQPLTSLFKPSSALRVETALKRIASGNGQIQIANLQIVCGDGREAEVILYLEAIREGGGGQIIGQVIDRTKEIEAQSAAQLMREELAHAARLSTLGEMASAIAHEINQPLTAIVTQAQAYRRLVVNSQATLSEIASGFEVIAEQALGIAQVVKRIRAFVTKRESISEEVDLEQVLLHVMKLSELDARRKDVNLEVRLSGDVPQISADSVQLQQVILNLIRNAIDASSDMPSGRRTVIIRTEMHGDTLSLRVIDRGPGISIQNQEKLFLPFFTTKPDGLGLGLSLSQSIVEAHGGTLTYRENPNGGSIFEICFHTNSVSGTSQNIER